MAAPILWAPIISVFFLQENLHVHKIPRFRGGGGILGLGGGAVPILCLGRGDFSEILEVENIPWATKLFQNYPARGNKYMSNSQRFFAVYVFILKQIR